MNILMFSMSGAFDWRRGVANRNRFVLKELARHPKVQRIVTVDLLPWTTKGAVKEWLKAGMTTGKRLSWDTVLSEWEGIPVCSTVASLRARHVLHQRIRQVIQFFHLDSDELILWNVHPFFADLLKGVDVDLSVFDVVDDWRGHAHFTRYREHLDEQYALMTSAYDVVFTVSLALKRRFSEHPNIHWIPNGVDLAHWSEPKKGSSVADRVARLPRPICGYHGVIQHRLDFDLLATLARHLPHVSFVLVGPTWPVFLPTFRPKAPEIQRLRKFPNVHLMGMVPYDETPSVGAQFDVAMIPHRQDELTKTMNPMKLYEYLAEGNRIVSTPVEGVEQFQSWVRIAKTPEAFVAAITEEIALGKTDRAARQAAVASMQWSHRVGEMIRKIETTLA
jgi:glycosyltransferase involved in cell wall biosynthesis